jgi:hypothetical protein
VDKALLAASRLANPHGQAVFFGKIHVFHNAMQVAHAQFKLPRNLGTPQQTALSPSFPICDTLGPMAHS